MLEARYERRLLKLPLELQAVKLLIIDELGYVPLSLRRRIDSEPVCQTGMASDVPVTAPTEARPSALQARMVRKAKAITGWRQGCRCASRDRPTCRVERRVLRERRPHGGLRW